MNKTSVEFDADGTTLRGWWARPDGGAKFPAIILTHGLSGTIALDLEEYAQKFVAAGFACLAYDHRNWGTSDGLPRSETDPWRQVADIREAISFVRTQSWVDAERVGLWGTSYAGGHVLTVSALDKRVKCAVSQVPLVSGTRTFNAWVPKEKQQKFLARIAADRDSRFLGQEPARVPAALPGSETAEWVERKDHHGGYVNEVTIRTFDLLRTYEPINIVTSIAPTPLLMIIASEDTQTPTDWQREAFTKMAEPKSLKEIRGRHYDVYMDHIEEAGQAACEWFKKHL